MSYRVPAIALLACLVASGAAIAAPAVLANIPLKWSPTSTLAEMGPLDLSAADLTVKVHVEALVDTRSDTLLRPAHNLLANPTLHQALEKH